MPFISDLFCMLIFLWVTLVTAIYVLNLEFHSEVVLHSWFQYIASFWLVNFCN